MIDIRTDGTRPTGGGHAPNAPGVNLLLAALLAVYALVVLRTAWLSDDAYITLRTIDNFTGGHGLRWNVAERVQAFTHPLWMLLLTVLTCLTGEVYLSTLGASVVLSLAAVTLLGWWARRAGAPAAVLAAGLGLLVMSRAFVDYSTSGLENPLTYLLLVGFFALFFEQRETTTRLYLLALLTGLATLNRMDTVLLCLPALAGELWRARRRRRHCVFAVLLGFAPFFLWEAFSVVYYGFLLPNTAYAKLHVGIGRLDRWERGLVYFRNSLQRDPLTLLAVAAGAIVGLLGGGRKRQAAAGIVLYLAYVLDIAGDFMSGRFFAAPLLVAAMILLAAGVHLRAVWPRRLLPVAVVLLGGLGAPPTLLSGRDHGTDRRQLLDDTGIADERAYYYPMTGLLAATPLASRPASEAAIRGKRARAAGDPLIVDGTIGFLSFFAGPDTYVLDYHALGDPLLARLPMVKSDPLFTAFCSLFTTHPCARPWRVGHYLRNVPDGYVDSILADENRLTDDKLHQLYDAIRLITRGPIWSSARWRAIVKMNLGLYDPLAGSMEPVDYRPTTFADAYEHHPDARSASVLAGAAREYVRRNAAEQAITCYRKLVAVDPGSIEGWNNLGGLLVSRGQTEEGTAALLAAIRLRPRRIEPYVAFGQVMEQTGRGPEAFRFFQNLASDGDQMAAEYLRQIQPIQ